MGIMIARQAGNPAAVTSNSSPGLGAEGIGFRIRQGQLDALTNKGGDAAFAICSLTANPVEVGFVQLNLRADHANMMAQI